MSLYREDVYETEDPPLPEPVDTEENFVNNEIEKIHIDLHNAKKRFVYSTLDPGNADFSDHHATMRLKRGYKASEIFDGEPIDEESFEQKYDKICLELKELTAQSKHLPDQTNMFQITGIYDLLKSISLKNSTIGKNMSRQVDNSDFDISTEWKTCFERQINHIENAICFDNALIDALDDLRSVIQKESSDELLIKANRAYELAIKYHALWQQFPELIRKIQCMANLNEEVVKLTAKIDDESDIKEQLEKKSEGNKAALLELKNKIRTSLEELFIKLDTMDEKIVAFKS